MQQGNVRPDNHDFEVMIGVKPAGGSVALGSCENRVLKLSLDEWESEIASRSYKGSEWLQI